MDIRDIIIIRFSQNQVKSMSLNDSVREYKESLSLSMSIQDGH